MIDSEGQIKKYNKVGLETTVKLYTCLCSSIEDLKSQFETLL